MTDVYITNNANDLVLKTAVTGPNDPDKIFTYDKKKKVKALTKEEHFLAFTGLLGGKPGDKYHATTKFMLGPVTFELSIELTASLIGSTFDVKVSASDYFRQNQSTKTLTNAGSSDFVLHLGFVDGRSLAYRLTLEKKSFLITDWRVYITLSPEGQSANVDIDLPYYKTVKTIALLDVWGEGRLTCHNSITGFTESYNINGRTIPMNCSDDPIPNRIPVSEYENPVFDIPDGIVEYETLMGAPITVGTAKEMYRVLNKKNGVVILYGFDMNNAVDKASVQAFESQMGGLVLKPKDKLKTPFDQIKIADNKYPVRIYGFPGVKDKNEL